MAEAQGALAGVRVLDLTDERGIYGAKLLADMGADVVRVEPPGGDALRARGPHINDREDAESSLYYAFFGSNRRSFVADIEQAHAQKQVRDLAAKCDVLLLCDGRYASALVAEMEHRTEQVVVNCSSFGTGGPWAGYTAPDLVAGALAGQVATTGDERTTPLKTFGELNFMVSGAYVGIAALAGLYCRRESGFGQSVEVPVHECIASCIEQVFMFYWYENTLMREEGKVLPRRGPTHWSDAYTVMNGVDGSIMITPTPDFDAQLAWLIEEDAHGDLIDPKYQEPEHLRERIVATMATLADWVANKSVEPLFYEAQERHIPYGWVQPIERVGHNPQLLARDWFVEHQVGEQTVRSSGAPYQFSETPWYLNDHAVVGQDTDEILTEIGWSQNNE